VDKQDGGKKRAQIKIISHGTMRSCRGWYVVVVVVFTVKKDCKTLPVGTSVVVPGTVDSPGVIPPVVVPGTVVSPGVVPPVITSVSVN